MKKKFNNYHIQLHEVFLINHPPEEEFKPKSLAFNFENHDDILHVIDRINKSSWFKNENDALEFGLGLKLFSEVMLRNRTNPLFEELLPEFKKFMTKLKKGA